LINQKTVEMDILALKIDLAQKILRSNKPDFLQKVEQLFRNEGTEDWWEELPQEIQDSINQGLKDAEEGNLLTHEQVVQETKEKYGF
jgi:predicted transcriptional regulator